ncbi:hypothetical protein Goari_023141 [Gossypium aridum]|uniref:Uncharacterized protein n=1 Tax=Gossypium aridum TaxID=34290 RepID=A0A7J8X220_GOSAI|nr:hypothetical protein [Gossypium aridum]
MNIFFHSLIMMITVIQKAIFAIFVKNVEIQIFGFIIVQHVILLLMSNVSLVDIRSSNPGISLKYARTFMSTLSLLLRRFITIRTAVSVVSPVLIWLWNVLDVTSLSIWRVHDNNFTSSDWED